LHQQVGGEGGGEHAVGAEPGHDVQHAGGRGLGPLYLLGQHGEAAHLAHGEHGQRGGADHGERELGQVGEDHRAQAAQGGVAQGERHQRAHGPPGRPGGHRVGHLERGHQAPPQHEAVDQQRVEERLHCPQHRGRPAAVPQLGQFRVGDHAAAAPQAAEQHDHAHVADRRAPPEPVACDALSCDDPRDRQRRVHGKGGRDHGHAEHPARQGAPGGEEGDRGARCLAAGEHPDRQGEAEVDQDDGHVGDGQVHAPQV